MTMFEDDLEGLFNRMLGKQMGGLNINNLLEQLKDTQFYGYTFTVGPDGQPIIKEFGNKSSLGLNIPNTVNTNKNNVDEIVTENEVKFVIDMAGLEKEDIKIQVTNDFISVSGQRGERIYNEKIPLRHKVQDPKATYLNGILELVFKKTAPTSYNVTVG